VAKKKNPVKKAVQKATQKAINKSATQKTTVKKSALKKAAVKKAVVKKPTLKKATKKPVSKPVKTVSKNSVKKTIQPVLKKTPAKTIIDYSKAVTPLGDRLVIRVVKNETMTAGGLYIPDMAQSSDGYLKGEVLAVGQGHTSKKGFLRSMDVQKGDHVLFAEHAGTQIVFNSEELQIVNETDVLGIVQN